MSDLINQLEELLIAKSDKIIALESEVSRLRGALESVRLTLRNRLRAVLVPKSITEKRILKVVEEALQQKEVE